MTTKFTNESKLLHLGHNGQAPNTWINLDDVHSKDINYSFNLGIPFADNSFEVIYISNVLERLDEYHRCYLLNECFRALKPSAIVRLSLKDLSKLTQSYTESLNELNQNNNTEKHTKILEEIFGKNQDPPEQDLAFPIPSPLSYYNGDKIQYIYDFYSIKEILVQIGFTNIEQKEYNSSSSLDFLNNNLDIDNKGNSKEPNNFYVEATKPALENSDTIKVAILNTYGNGGAANSALRQHKALRHIGVNSICYTGEQRQSTKECVYPAPYSNIQVKNNGNAVIASFYNEWLNWNNELNQYPNRLNKDEYCAKSSDSINPNLIPHFSDFNIINFEWVIGFADPAIHPEYYQGKKLVWTLHDMNPFTGGCHYSGTCEKFKTACKNCPFLRSGRDNDLAAEIFNRKLEAYSKLDLHIVAPSDWMAKQAKESKLFSKFPISVIRYPQPLDTFTPLNKESIRKQLNISPDDIVLLFTADSIASERKGVKYLYEMLLELAKTALAPRIMLLVMGANVPNEIASIGFRGQLLGYVSSMEKAAIYYNIADALIVPSLEDNSPNTICEALGCGTPVIAFKSGGIPEMIVHEKTGYLAERGNSKELLKGVEWLSTVHGDLNTRKACREFAEKNYNEKIQAEKYKKLYHEISKQEAKIEKTEIISNPIITSSNNAIKVTVDARCLLYKMITSRGIGHYVKNLLHTIAKIHPEINFTLSVEEGSNNSPLKEEFTESNFNFSFYGPAYPLDADLFFIPDPMSIMPYYRSPFSISRNIKISSIFYDFTPLIYHKYFEMWDKNQQNDYMTRLEEIKSIRPQILAISESTKKDCIERLNLSADNIEVIMAGLNESHLLQEHTDSEINDVLNRFNIKQPFFLTVGSCDFHKNFDFSVSSTIALLTDYYSKKIKDIPYLVVVGDEKDPMKMGFKELLSSKEIDNVIFTGYLSQKDLGCLYAKATALLFPSSCEGFGLPVLEAMANKCAVITTRNTSLPEVAGNAGIYVEIGDQDAMKSAMLKLMYDDNYRQNLIELGYQQSKKFSWEKTAEKTVQAWNKLISLEK